MGGGELEDEEEEEKGSEKFGVTASHIYTINKQHVIEVSFDHAVHYVLPFVLIV